MEDLRGQHVVVTGATGGLGPSLVEVALACGANVTAVARRRTALDGLRADMRQNARLNTAEGDVGDGASVERLFDALERGTGPIDAVVHAVGAFIAGPLAQTADDAIDTLYRVVFLSSALVARAAVRRMAPRGHGRIVLVGAASALRPTPGLAVYGAMKSAVAHLVQSIAIENRDTGVMVNAVLPGTMDTPDNRRSGGESETSRWVAPRTVAKAVAALLGDGGTGVTGSLVTLPDRL